MSLVVPSIGLLFVAPLVHAISVKRDYLFSLLNGFVFVLIAGLVALEIVPELIQTAGFGVVLMMLLGLALPVLIEKSFHHTEQVHKAAIFIGVFGLALHTLADGAALAMQEHEHSLALGVVLHRVPIGLFVWWFIRPHFGLLAACAMLVLIAMGTLVGFYQSEVIVSPLESQSIAYFQAFVVGTLVHVLLHRPPVDGVVGMSSPKTKQRAEGIGNLLGLMCAFYLLVLNDQHTEISWLTEAGDTLLYLSLETAPMLLLALLLAGVIKAFMPASFANWLSRGSALRQACKGMAVGIPLPLCSCSVVPVYHSLIKKGAPTSAAIAFLIATPELGIDALLISLPLLGVEMTLVRLVAAALLAITVALLVARFSSWQPHSPAHTSHAHTQAPKFLQKLADGMHYSVHDLFDHIAPWLLVGLILAAFMQPFIGQLLLTTIATEWQVLLFAMLGIPMYVCASSATPLVAILLMNGVSPGAGLAFLLAGPASNVTTFGVLAKLHNRQTAVLLAVSCLATSVLLGLATNIALPNFQPLHLVMQEEGMGMLNWGTLIALLLLFGYSIYRKGLRACLSELLPHHHPHAETEGGSCSHGHKDCSHHRD